MHCCWGISRERMWGQNTPQLTFTFTFGAGAVKLPSAEAVLTPQLTGIGNLSVELLRNWNRTILVFTFVTLQHTRFSSSNPFILA